MFHVVDHPALTHWGRVTHICVSDLTRIISDNGLSSGRRQAIIRTNAGILLIRPLGTNFSEFLVEILIFSFKKMRLKVSSAKRRAFCLGLNELNQTTWHLLGPEDCNWLFARALVHCGKSMILWSKLTLVLNVLYMWMTLFLCINLPLSMLSKENYNILSTD